MKLVEVAQGEPWLAWRAKGLGSSDAPVVLNGKHFRRDRAALWREKVGLGERGEENWAMARGKRLEPEARALYERLMGYPCPPACGVHDRHPWLKASFDGWNAEYRVLLEIKAPGKADHEAALAGEVPSKYHAQLQHQILVTGPGPVTCHYASYHPGYDGADRLVVLTYAPSPGELSLLLRLEQVFWSCVVSGTPPEEHMFTA
jgi:putative phage-type endonuclease